MSGMGASGYLGIASTFFGDVSDRMAARERARGIKQQAQDLDVQATLEKINAQNTEADLRDQLLRTLSGNIAAFGASGVALGSPTATATGMADIDEATRMISAKNLEALLRVKSLRRSANTLRKQSKMTAISGNLAAGSRAMNSLSGIFGGMGGGGGGGGGGSAFTGGSMTGDFSSAMG